MCLATRVLMDGDQGRNAAPFGIYPAHQVAGTLGRNHDDVNIGRRNDGLEMNAEAVGKAEDLALRETRLDILLVEVALSFVGSENLDPVGFLCCLGWRENREAIRFRLGGATPARVQTDNHAVAAVAEVLGLRVSLTAVAEDGDGLALEGIWIGVVLIKDGCHGNGSPGCSRRELNLVLG